MKKILFVPIILFLFIIMSCTKETEVYENSIEKARTSHIAVRTKIDNSQEFYDQVNEKRFVPMGYNYTHVRQFVYDGIELTGHCTFNIDMYDSEEAQQMFAKLNVAGYNTVRVFLNPLSMADNEGKLELQYVANVVDFLTQAEKQGMSVIITLDMIPLKLYGTPLESEADIWWWNQQYIDENQILLEVNFWTSFIQSLKQTNAPLNAILSYELRNEFFFHPEHAPLNQSNGQIIHPNGKIYDMSKEDDKTKLIEESFVYWSSSVRNAILVQDIDALVSVGFYAPEPYGKPSIIAIEKSELDFVDVHLYPNSYQKNQYADYFKLSQNSNKLIIMGEFGIIEEDNHSTKEIANQLFAWKNDFVEEYKIDGWLLWTWETKNSAKISISDTEQFIFKKMSPKN